jgi:DNA-binding CsgD family transcriptional regulator
MIQQDRTIRRRTPPRSEDGAGQAPLWADVTELAESVIGSTTAPPGFVRYEIPVAGGHAEAYRGVEVHENGNRAMVVVIVAPSAPQRLADARVLERRFGLTPREAEVAVSLAARKSNKEIAAELNIAHSTAWRHTEQVLSKLRAGSRRDVRRVLESAVDV